MKAGRRNTPIPEASPGIEPLLEPGYGRHAEGITLSGHTRSCVEAVRQR